MIDIKLIRESPDLVRENIRKKFQDDKLKLVDRVIELDLKWRREKKKVDDLRSERNRISESINKLMKSGNKSKAKDLIVEAKEIPLKIEKVEGKASKLVGEIEEIMMKIPNMMWKGVPLGKSDVDNVEIRKWGKIPKFDFEVKNHVEIGEALDVVDFDKSAKVAGKGFYYLKGDLALLNQALISFARDFMIKKGYTYIEPPLMLNEKEIYASMDKNAIAESVYEIKGAKKGLIGTAEQSILAYHSGDTIMERDLPKKYFSYSMCFRQEIGAHGINEKGLWRTHQFNKVEQFVFCMPEDSEKIYDELLANSEEIVQALELPYRVLELCTGDLADWKYRSADIEVWRPTMKAFGEVVSLSNCTDYQARKLNIRYVSKDGKTRGMVHTLNDTALATSRIMVAIMENFQNKDGSVSVPKVLVPYMVDGKKVIGK
ncbi:MAG: serine--tRNA ligase [Nanoarchaeota archaeon]|nr:serine--tRNA ligase [Nanoarchaeota archaeon]